MSSYQLQTARTAKQQEPSVFKPSTTEPSPLENREPADMFADPLTLPPGIEALRSSLTRAVDIPGFNAQRKRAFLPHRRIDQSKSSEEPEFSPVEFEYTTMGLSGSVSSVTLRSAGTQPASNVVNSFLSPIGNTTSSNAREIVLLGMAYALAGKDADEGLSNARAAALSGNLRLAYRNLYRGLDSLLKVGNWQRVGAELNEICSSRYPVTFGIGAMRFLSSAADRIPNWSDVLYKLIVTARQQNQNVPRLFRGLLEIDGAT